MAAATDSEAAQADKKRAYKLQQRLIATQAAQQFSKDTLLFEAADDDIEVVRAISRKQREQLMRFPQLSSESRALILIVHGNNEDTTQQT